MFIKLKAYNKIIKTSTKGINNLKPVHRILNIRKEVKYVRTFKICEYQT